METIYSILILVHITLNLILTLLVLNHKYLANYKKFAKLILIWLVPILGLLWVWIMMRTKNDQNGNNNDPIAYSWFGSFHSDSNSSDNGSDGGGGGD